MSIEERMDTFETEELVYNAKMSYGNINEMAKYMDKLGELLVSKETALQSVMLALEASVSASQMEQIVNLADQCMSKYLNRFTTDEMKEKLEKEGVGNLAVVLLDEDYANEAIENGRDVFAIKNGNMELLNKHGEASKYAKDGYLLAVSPFTYEAEFCDDLDKALDEE